MKGKFLKFLPLIILLIILAPLFRGNAGSFIILIIILIIIFKIFSSGREAGWFRAKDKDMTKTIDLDNLKSIKKVKKAVFIFVLIVLLVWLFFASIVIVEAGQTGVYSLFGRVKDKELRSGFHLVIPLARVTKISIRTEEYTMSIIKGEGKIERADSITSLTKEGLEVDLDITVLHRLNEEYASDIYKNVGLTYEEKIIRPAIRTTIREVVAKYEAKDLYSDKRGEAAMGILESLKIKLEPRGIVAEDVLLRNVALPANLAQSIQEKLQAEQEAQKYDFILEKEKKEKERKIIEAEGQKESQRIINQSLTQNYLYYLYIKELKDREGTIYVPTSPSTGMPLFRDIGR